ncbi:MAG: histidinol-phosphate transaminase [Atopobiaceae bacterium]|jgi:histidinol-phosphate aminotransferase|nr:histidinol-phosphate transaminase [Atopobiaceae bacterium]MCI2172946.1 histidinol-phosphate transaminase [Atopobiaceae bacterium]MCI2208351.1 histidinol-phosphate transaminase [Atopobiaceae bacterium]
MAALSERARRLMRPSLAGLEPYDPGFTPTRVILSANENDYGMPAEVHDEVMAAMSGVATNRYPDPMSNRLRDAIAGWHGVARGNVFVGDGGDECLFDLFLAFGGQGRRLVNCPPTFSVYALYASMVDTEVVDVPRDPETMALDAAATLAAAADADLVVLTSPNNPTGDLVPVDLVSKVCDACPGLVLVDEAYGEFAPAGSSAEPLLPAHDNLIVLHTFSKAYCLAGARCGYLLAAPDVVDALAAVRQPYSVSSLTQAAAEVVCRRRDAFEPAIASTVAERARVIESIDALGSSLPIRVWPSEANFVLVRVPHASQLRARLRDEYSILVRDFSDVDGLADCLRVTIGTPAENDLLLDALATLVKEES